MNISISLKIYVKLAFQKFWRKFCPLINAFARDEEMFDPWKSMLVSWDATNIVYR